MPLDKHIEEATKDNVLVASIVAKHLGLPLNFFANNTTSTTLNKEINIFKIEGVMHVKLPNSLIKGLSSYQAVVLDIQEQEEEYAYTVPLNKNKKIGFWR